MAYQYGTEKIHSSPSPTSDYHSAYQHFGKQNVSVFLRVHHELLSFLEMALHLTRRNSHWTHESLKLSILVVQVLKTAEFSYTSIIPVEIDYEIF